MTRIYDNRAAPRTQQTETEGSYWVYAYEALGQDSAVARHEVAGAG